MAEIRKLDPADLARFADQFRAYLGPPVAISPRAPDPSAIVPPLTCRSPRGSCRYGSCALRGACQAVAA
jgi:hypothetical protein